MALFGIVEGGRSGARGVGMAVNRVVLGVEDMHNAGVGVIDEAEVVSILLCSTCPRPSGNAIASGGDIRRAGY